MSLRCLLGAARLARGEGSQLGAQLLRPTAACNTLVLRAFSSESSTPQDSGNDSQAADRETRRQEVAARLMQGKNWRSWVERKLDETVAAKEPEWVAVEEEAGVTDELQGEQAAALDVADVASAIAADEVEAAAIVAAAAAPAKIRRHGTLAQQEIFDIVFDRKREDVAGPAVPSGLPSRYSSLVDAKDAPQVVRGGGNKADSVSPARVHPYRLFYPGQMYTPQDLDPYKAREMARGVDAHPGRRAIPSSQVVAKADFRNPGFLASFLSESGKLKPRRQTRLRQKLHRHLGRQIKLARQLGLLDPTSRVLPHKRHGQQEAAGGQAAAAAAASQ